MDNALEYLRERQCAAQWKTVLRAVAQELTTEFSAGALRRVVERIGRRVALETPLPTCDTLEQVQAAINRIWELAEWGEITLREDAAALVIVHHCSPLQAAFGNAGSGWAPAFLVGVYQEWFRHLGASDVLRVQQTTDADADGCIEFRLGR
jgi:hypothetical protein